MSFEKEKKLLEKKLADADFELAQSGEKAALKAGAKLSSADKPSRPEAEADGRVKAKHLHEFFVEKIFKKIESLEGKVATLEKEIETLKASQAASAANTGTP